jgi:hypothetical protein
MTKPQVKNLLQLLAIFKTFPTIWWRGLYKYYPETNYGSYITVVDTAVRSGLIEKREKITGEQLLYLTVKGYQRIIDSYQPIWKYHPFHDKSNRKSLAFSVHQYLVFVFYYNQIINGVQGVYLTDFDTKECYLTLRNMGQELRLKPDGIIRQDEGVLSVFESDMSTESVKRIFDKVLKYILYAKQNFDGETFNQIKVYFICKSTQRVESLIGKRQGLIKLFNQGSVLQTKAEKIKERIDLKTMFSLLDEDKAEFYFGNYQQNIDTFLKLDIKGSLLVLNPELEKYNKSLNINYV